MSKSIRRIWSAQEIHPEATKSTTVTGRLAESLKICFFARDTRDAELDATDEGLGCVIDLEARSRSPRVSTVVTSRGLPRGSEDPKTVASAAGIKHENSALYF